jgi:hypothetical protein
MIVEKQMECRLAGETEVLGENLLQRHSCPSQNPISPDPGLNPDSRGGKPATIFFYYEVCEAIGTAVTPGLLCQPRIIVKMIVEKPDRQGKPKFLEKTCLSATFVPHKIPHDQTRV